jgi:hypothetical protein
MTNIHFRNTDSEHLKECFRIACGGFPALHNHKIIVRKIAMGKTTMRAQPVINLSFLKRKKRQFYVDFSARLSSNQDLKVEKLPRKVLIGWFAHELGHVMDYLDRSAFQIVGFGIGYILHEHFRIGAERKADLYAITHGFADYIIETKKYILEQSSFPDSYKRRIETYYMSPDEVALMARNEEAKSLRMDQIL